MSEKFVTNPLTNTTVVVANRHIGPGASRAIPSKDLDRWLAKGGQRLLDAGKIVIGAVPGPTITIKAAPDPVVDVPRTFDGAPVDELLVTPDEREESGAEIEPPADEAEPGPEEEGDFGMPSVQTKPAKTRRKKG